MTKNHIVPCHFFLKRSVFYYSCSIINNALHPYTKALIAAVCEPVPGKSNTIKEIPIKGEIPSAANIPPGCRFHPRCLYVKPK